MKLVSFSPLADPANIRPGFLITHNGAQQIAPIASASTLEAIAANVTSPNSSASLLPLDQVRLHAPLANPPRIFCIGLNYRDHAIESGMEIPKFPVVFFKMAPSIIGPNEPIVLPSITKEPDYEAEFAFILGKGGYQIQAADAMDHV